MVKPILLLNLVGLKYYPCMIGLDKYTGGCNVSFRKCLICCEKSKRQMLKVFEMIVNENETKTMKKHISCDCKWKFHSATCNSNQEWNNETCQCACKN